MTDRPLMTWAELMYRLAHCSDCDCEHDQPPREGCDCVCHAETVTPPA